MRSGHRTRAAEQTLALLLSCLAVCGCAAQATAIGLASSSASRAPGDTTQATAAASSIDEFGFDLYGRLGSNPGNLVFSPTSLAIALSMAGAGARGDTAAEMEKVLHVGSGASAADEMNSLDQALASIDQTYTDSDGKAVEVRFRSVNAPFAQSGMKIEPAYLDTLASRYGASLRLVDFIGDPAGSCQQINEWADQQTAGRIPKILDSLDSNTRLVLTNATYLKAPWLSPFEKGGTVGTHFSLADGSVVDVPTMNESGEFRYAAGKGWQAVELPYRNQRLVMTILVPDDLASFEQGLDEARFKAIDQAMSPTRLQLWLPRFATGTSAELAGTLAAMGMPLAFNPADADFSGITTAERLFIAKVAHRANISVDENGTEAAAVTAVVMAEATAPSAGLEVHVDRPFVFVLRDTQTGAILFLGRIVDPSATAS